MKHFHFKDHHPEEGQAALDSLDMQAASDPSRPDAISPAFASEPLSEEDGGELTRPLSSRMDTVVEQVDAFSSAHMNRPELSDSNPEPADGSAEASGFSQDEEVIDGLTGQREPDEEQPHASIEADAMQKDAVLPHSMPQAAEAAPMQSVPQPEPYGSPNTVTQARGPFVAAPDRRMDAPAAMRPMTNVLIHTSAGETSTFAVRYILNAVGILIGIFGIANNLPFTLFSASLYSMIYASSFRYFSIGIGQVIGMAILALLIVVWFLLAVALAVFSAYCLAQNIRKQRIQLTVDDTNVYGRDERGTAFNFPIASITDVRFLPSRLPESFRSPWSNGLEIDSTYGKLLLPSLVNAGRVKQILDEKLADRPKAPQDTRTVPTPPAAPKV